MSQAGRETHRLSSYCGRFYREQGRWPATEELLAMRDDLPTHDPWGQPYRVAVSDDGASARVVSDGSDGACDTCDDVAGPRYTVLDGVSRH